MRPIIHLGVRYYRTGKTGTHFATGLPATEYEAEDGRRLWAVADGTVDDVG